MEHYIFHVGGDGGADATAVALGPDLARTERSAPDLAAAVAALMQALGGQDWRVFEPTAAALGLDAARTAPPDEAQAIVMADAALAALGLGPSWRLDSKTAQYAILRFVAALVDSRALSVPGRAFPYRCGFDGTIDGSCGVIAGRNLTHLSVTMMFAEADMRRAFETTISGTAFDVAQYVALTVGFDVPWCVRLFEGLFGVGFVPDIANVDDGQIYALDDRTGLALGAIAYTLSATREGGEAEARIAVEDHDFRCRLTRLEL